MLSPEYVTGLCEAAASFTYSLQGGTPPNLTPYFSLKLPRTDLQLVRQVQGFFGVGRVYAPTESAPRAAALFRSTHRDELLRILTHFEIYPLAGRKGGAFSVWKRLVREKQKPSGRQDRDNLLRWARQLSEMNRKNARAAFHRQPEASHHG